MDAQQQQRQRRQPGTKYRAVLCFIREHIFCIKFHFGRSMGSQSVIHPWQLGRGGMLVSADKRQTEMVRCSGEGDTFGENGEEVEVVAEVGIKWTFGQEEIDCALFGCFCVDQTVQNTFYIV